MLFISYGFLVLAKAPSIQTLSRQITLVNLISTINNFDWTQRAQASKVVAPVEVCAEASRLDRGNAIWPITARIVELPSVVGKASNDRAMLVW